MKGKKRGGEGKETWQRQDDTCQNMVAFVLRRHNELVLYGKINK